MLMLRLARYGVKKKPFYRIIAIDKRKARNGRPKEYLGYYCKQQNENDIFKIDIDKLNYLIKNGAKLSNRLNFLIKKFTNVFGIF